MEKPQHAARGKRGDAAPQVDTCGGNASGRLTMGTDWERLAADLAGPFDLAVARSGGKHTVDVRTRYAYFSPAGRCTATEDYLLRLSCGAGRDTPVTCLTLDVTS